MDQLAHLVQHYGLAIVFLNVLADQIGLPVPSTPLLLVAGAMSLTGDLQFPAALLTAVGATMIADFFWYSAGKRSGRGALRLLCRISLSPDSCVRQTESLFGRVGPAALLFAKFIPGLGCVTMAMAGLVKLRLPVFLALDAVGAAIFLAVPLLLGRLFHDAVDSIVDTIVQLGGIGIGLLAGAAALYIAIRWVQRQLFIRRLRMDRISVAELAGMIARGAAPVILDVRARADRLSGGIIPNALAAHPMDPDFAPLHQPRDVEIVIYCACPNEASAAIAAAHLKRAGFKKIRPLLGGVDAWVAEGHSLEFPAAAA